MCSLWGSFIKISYFRPLRSFDSYFHLFIFLKSKSEKNGLGCCLACLFWKWNGVLRKCRTTLKFHNKKHSSFIFVNYAIINIKIKGWKRKRGEGGGLRMIQKRRIINMTKKYKVCDFCITWVLAWLSICFFVAFWENSFSK